MTTITSPSTSRTPLIPSRMAVPPPTAAFDLRDADTVVGWVDGRAIGFHGFDDETEAAHAAWVAYRTMARRFARELGGRPIPVDVEPLSLDRSGDVERILASGRPIATLVRPGAGSPRGTETFGFELQTPAPADELAVRSTAYLVYRALRRSGIRWAMWAPAPRASAAPDESRIDERAPAAAERAQAAPRGDADTTGVAAGGRDRTGVAIARLVLVVAFALAVLPAIPSATIVRLLGGVAALVALVAVVSLAGLVGTDIRDSLQERRRRMRPRARFAADDAVGSAS